MKRFDAYYMECLSGLASIFAGYPFRGKIDELPDGDVAVIQMRNVDRDVGIDWQQLSRVKLPRMNAKAFLSIGDIILSTRGGRNVAYMIDKQVAQLVCSPHFFVIRTKGSEVLPEFLAWQLNQRPAQDHFSAGATGSHILNLKRDVVEALRLVVPPLATQRSIVKLYAEVRAERAILAKLIENRSDEMNAIALKILTNNKI